jgi:hypothetical protein
VKVHPYKNQRAVLTTKHDKLALIAPAMLEKVGLEVAEVKQDTDQLGTFSGEIPRVGSPLESAIAKAKLGIDATGIELGLASEGSIGPDPQNPFLTSDIELLVLVDQQRNLIIHEVHRSFEIIAASKDVTPGEDLSQFLEDIDFPNHRLIAKSVGAKQMRTIKGIESELALASAISELAGVSQRVTIETDFRANQSPSRQLNIQAAAEKLANRLIRLCESCQAPGFGQIRYLTGLRCTGCGMVDSDAIAAEILTCVSCDHEVQGKKLADSLAPERCGWCNP